MTAQENIYIYIIYIYIYIYNTSKRYITYKRYIVNLVKDISQIPDDNLTRFKNKLRSTCERYSKIHVAYEYKTIIERLLKNQSICIMKQDKGPGAVVMDKSKNTQKCLNILQTEQFTKQRHDPTKSIENKIQRELRKLKKKRLTIQEYRQLYPTDSNPVISLGSNPGRFYGTANYISFLLMAP